MDVMRRATTVLTLGFCAFSGRAAAEPGAGKPPALAKTASPSPQEQETATYTRLLLAADVDQDAHVSASEFENFVRGAVQRQLKLRFQRLDRNGDGKVEEREVPTMAAERFRRFDANGNGSFTAPELAKVLLEQATARCRAALARLDHDGDGTLSAADVEQPLRVSKR
jgi:Ca2+-binding EF-hand superfamily protein